MRKFPLDGSARVLASLLISLSLFWGASACKSRKAEESTNALNLALGTKIKGIDPAYVADLYSANQAAYTYEPLYQYHYLKRPYEVIPQLAEAMPEISADGKTYTIKIKKGVLFQDDPVFKDTGGKGRELTAEDFVYSWKRIADPKLLTTSWWILEDKVVGLDEWRAEMSKAEKVDYAKPVAGLKALDRYTLQLSMKRRVHQLVYLLAMVQMSAVAREAVDALGNEFMNRGVGTGPFKLQEHVINSKLVWVKNPTFRKELYPSEGEAKDQVEGRLADAGKQLPLVDRVNIQIFSESQPLWLTFMSGKLDSAGIPKDSYNQAITATKDLTPEMAAKGIQLHITPGIDITFDSFNMTDPVVGKNRSLRQAISLAIDQKKLNEIFYNGRAIPAQGPIPPGLQGYDPDFKNPYRQYDLAKAKELMKKAGYPEGRGLPPLEFMTMSDSTHRQFTEFFEKSLAEIGVKLRIRTMSWPEFNAAIKQKQGQIAGFAWSADYPDAENFLMLFYGKNISPGPNNSNYSNPEYDKLFEKAMTLPDSPERTKLYREMAKIVVEDCPWVFGAHRLNFFLTQPWLKNFKYHEFQLGVPKYYRLDQAAKK